MDGVIDDVPSNWADCQSTISGPKYMGYPYSPPVYVDQQQTL